jgi:hypothetical protein
MTPRSSADVSALDNRQAARQRSRFMTAAMLYGSTFVDARWPQMNLSVVAPLTSGALYA